MRESDRRPTEIGRYRLVDELARTAGGVVYKAWDPLIDRIVAVKTVDLDLPPDEIEAFQKRLEREVRAAGRLNHPNIVTIYDVGRSGNVAYIATEFIDGRSLRELLDSGAVLPPAKVADMTAQIADGLDFAHEHGIVHRDVKPDSIVVLRTWTVKLTNFGIAKVSSGSRTRMEAPNNGPVYLSPEQVMGRPADERSDLFSLGLILFEMLTGQPPFAAAKVTDTIQRIIHESPPPPTRCRRGIPAAFDEIVAKATAKNPNDRYRSAREMGLRLRKLASAAKDNESQIAPIAPPSERSSHTEPVVDAEFENLPATEAQSEDATGARVRTRRRRKRLLCGLTAAIVATAAGLVLQSLRRVDDPNIDERAIASKPSDAVAENGGGTSRQDTATAPRASEISAAADTLIAAPPAVAVPHKDIAPTARSTARLRVAVSPWGEVFVNGKSKGVAPPLRELRLSPGTYVVEIRNANFAPYRNVVELKADGKLQIKHKFDQ